MDDERGPGWTHRPRSLICRPTALLCVAVLALAACGVESIPDVADLTGSPSLGGPETPGPGESTVDPGPLDELVVAPEASREGYDRARFKHWSDLDGNGCNARQEVLIRQSLVQLVGGLGCAIPAGLWFSAFDGVTTTVASLFDIDHFVPLAEAWDSGANTWTDERRELYANDLDHPSALIAVSRSSNRSKGDRDPAEWLPPLEEFWCTYVATWVDIKLRWELTVDEAEMAALREVHEDCEPG